jgi:hypothetical protein
VVRQVGITLSIAGDRELMGRYAEQLEKEASELETRADTDAIATAVEAPGD